MTKISPKIMDDICDLVANGKSIREIAEMPGMPAMRTIFLWLRNDDDFQHSYTLAKQEQADLMVEEMLQIADNPDIESVHRDKLRIDTRKWCASRYKPKKYGDATLMKLGDNEGNKLDSVQQALIMIDNKRKGLPEINFDQEEDSNE